jgi:hypothetical protein
LYIDGFLVILFDPVDRFTQAAMQRGVTREILADCFVDSIELSLDDTFFRLATGGQQHLAVSIRKSLFGTGDGYRCCTKHLVQRVTCSKNDFMRCRPCEIQSADDQYYP